MAAGRRGVFAISWEQTEIDGMAGAPPDELAVGASWRWGGEALRIDGPAGLMPLTGAAGAAELGARVARKARRLAGAPPPPAPPPELADAPPAAGFTVTDGRRAWAVAVAAGRRGPILVLDGELPPPSTELWVVRRSGPLGALAGAGQPVAGLAAGTRIATPEGPRRIEDIRPGEPVLTRDAGPMPVLWVGRQTVSGARLRLRPALRPLLVPAAGRPGGGGAFRVAPRQRLVVAGRAVAAAFGAAEALAAAADLLDDWPLRVDHGQATVTYIQLMVARHQLILAEGRAVASFDPAEAPAGPAAAAGLAGLDAAWPGLAADPDRFGPPARRLLSRAEVAILAHRRPPLG